MIEYVFIVLEIGKYFMNFVDVFPYFGDVHRPKVLVVGLVY
jgi:hypothetical protein